MISIEKAKEILLYMLVNGKKKTLETYNITEETLYRYQRLIKKELGIDIKERDLLNELLNNFTAQEIKSIFKSGKYIEKDKKRINFDGDIIRIGAMSDLHLGSIYTDVNFIYSAFEEFDKQNVNFVVIGGDIVEGMSNRAGHIYELTHIGYQEQLDYAVSVLSQWDKTPMYMIDGNHDRWFIKSSGAYIVKNICDAIPNAEFLGHDEGDIYINDNVFIKLWHGEDGNSYAISYRIQKIIEALRGGEKPNILLAGHVHKALYIFERNIHAVSLGSIQKQSKWMRGKRIPAHTGFWVIEFTINERGVVRFTPQWFPFYL